MDSASSPSGQQQSGSLRTRLPSPPRPPYRCCCCSDQQSAGKACPSQREGANLLLIILLGLLIFWILSWVGNSVVFWRPKPGTRDQRNVLLAAVCTYALLSFQHSHFHGAQQCHEGGKGNPQADLAVRGSSSPPYTSR